MVALTIGMATYNDFNGIYFTLQALSVYQDLTDTELLVIDNFGCKHTKRFIDDWSRARYVLATDAVGTAAPRERIFREARGDAVLCCDSHVLFLPDTIARLKAYYRAHPDCIDLLQGPLVYDDLSTVATHFDPVWREQMWGIWATDPRGLDPEGEPFEIPMQGLGVFSCRTDVWPGFNPAFRGFGGEEGYIHEKFRQRGGRTLCLPWLRWVHRFDRPKGAPYPLNVEDKLRNYLIGHTELQLDASPVLEHFADYLHPQAIARIRKQALQSAQTSGGGQQARSKRGKRRHNPADNTSSHRHAKATPAAESAHPSTTEASSGEVKSPPTFGFVLGWYETGNGSGGPQLQKISLLQREDGESEASHLSRIERLLERTINCGGTHLLIPAQAAVWIADYPRAFEFLLTHHAPIEMSLEAGFLFALRVPRPEGKYPVAMAQESSACIADLP